MSRFRYFRPFGLFVLLAALAVPALIVALGSRKASAEDHDDWRNPWEIKHVFVIAMENHNWTQPVTLPNDIQPVFQNPNAPFINSLVNGTAFAFVDGRIQNISKHVA